ncbi:MAG: hypothetical protein KGJ89_05475 [Patescibacteria group bacterium]|nr:hypothetical protein [Patescibacteria group bacterium]
MKKIKNKAASQLAHLRWDRTTPEDRKKISRMLLRARAKKRRERDEREN